MSLKIVTNLLDKEGLDAVIIPSTDEWQNEYVPQERNLLYQAIGFSGSAGIVIITRRGKVVFFTDSRYLLQAQRELDSAVTILDMRYGLKVLREYLLSDSVIGYDPMLHSYASYRRIKAELAEFRVQELTKSLHWYFNRGVPKTAVLRSAVPPIVLPDAVTGMDSQAKIAKVLDKIDADYALINSPYSIAWLLNIRGCDIPYTPIILGYLLLSKKKSMKKHIFFTDAEVPNEYLDQLQVEKYPLGVMQKCYSALEGTIELDPNVSAAWFWQAHGMEKNHAISERIHAASVSTKDMTGNIAPESQENGLAQPDTSTNGQGKAPKLLIKSASDPTEMMRACKNETELASIEKVHFEEAKIALKLWEWLENNIGRDITEFDVSCQLEFYRKQNPTYLYESFPTIAAYGSNAAVVHYRPTDTIHARIDKNNVLLLDCGGQYRYGTTDMTRVFAVGDVSEECREVATAVLRGHIFLARCVFPKGTSGSQLDVLARYHLWQLGLDYGHSTGHGVGHFLAVHEGPQGLSKYNSISLREGMVVTVEPGFYKADHYGIRLENAYVVKASQERPGFLYFQPLTLLPFDDKLINFECLSHEELQWLCHYYELIHDAFGRDVNEFLRNKTVRVLSKAM